MSDINEEQKRLYKRAEENDIKLLKEENKKLKKLCNKYEEEHNNEFQCWKRDRKELLDKRNIINKAIEYINKMCLCSDGYANYGDDLSPEHIVNILQSKEK